VAFKVNIEALNYPICKSNYAPVHKLHSYIDYMLVQWNPAFWPQQVNYLEKRKAEASLSASSLIFIYLFTYFLRDTCYYDV